MVIEKNRVVTIEYLLQDTDGEVLDSSEGGEPLVYLHGNDNIIGGLEKQLEGKKAGDDVDCLVPAVEAYGERDDSLVFTVPKSEFGPNAEVEVGMQFEAHGEGGAQIVTVVEVKGDEISIDANHPLAGEDLHFTVKVVDVREATADEIQRGRVGGECGCGGGDCGDGSCGCGCGGGCQ
jgi:FKBP-type peptidyl-prolyl cis-trans isomerase SlyD